MTTPKLPAQVRVHIRDLIENENSQVQGAVKSLNTVLGSGFRLEIAWQDIYRDLKSEFADDMDKLVPAVGRHLSTFISRLESVLEQDETFQEAFVELYTSLRPGITAVIQSGSKTSCKIVERRILLLLPTTGNEGYRRAEATVGEDIPLLVKDDEEDDPSPHDEAEEEWDTVNVESSRADSGPRGHTRTAIKFDDAASKKPQALPKLKSLQRPEILFADLLPALLTVRGGSSDLWIEGSHAPTIVLIGQYFENYARKDMNSSIQAPLFKITQLTSNFGSGTMTDCIHIEQDKPHYGYRINIALFLSFIEGVCGYEPVECQNFTYTYRRSVPFL